MATALTLITNAMQEIGAIGAGETPTGDDTALCLDALNQLLDSWRLDNLLIFTSSKVTASLPANTSSLTIGTGLQLNTARPVRIEVGSYITASGLDLALDQVNEKDYNDIVLKGINGPWPAVFWYDTGFPTANVFFWPRGACTVNLIVQTPLSTLPLSTTTFSMPPGYQRALSLTLAEEIAPKFERKVSELTMTKAANARRNVKRMNFIVPQLEVRSREFNERNYFGIP